MILNTAALDTAVVNGSASNTQSLAASLTAASSAAANLVPVKSVATGSTAQSSATGSVVLSIPLGTSAQSVAAGSGTTNSVIPLGGSAVVTCSSAANLDRQVILLSGPQDYWLGGSVMDGGMLGGGTPFVGSSSTMIGEVKIIFPAAGNLQCQSYALGSLLLTIPLADLAGTTAVSNVGSANLHLDIPVAAVATAVASASVSADVSKPIGASAQLAVTSSVTLAVTKGLTGPMSTQVSYSAPMALTVPLGAQAQTVTTAGGGLVDVIPLGAQASASVAVQNSLMAVTKGMAGSVALTATSAPAVTSVAYIVAANASAVSSLSANLKLTKIMGGSSSNLASAFGSTKVDYVIAATAAIQAAATAALKKTANLSDLDGTAAVANVMLAALHLDIPLGGSSQSAASVVRDALLVAHAINIDELFTQTNMNVEYRIVEFDVSSAQIYATVDSVTYAQADWETQPT